YNLAANIILNNGQTPHNSIVESNACIPVIPDNQNHLRRITCSKTKLQVDRNHGSIRNCDSDSSERNIVILESDVFATKTTKDASTPCNAKLHTLSKNAQSGRRDQGKKRKAVIRISKADNFHLEIINPGLAPRISPAMGSMGS
ncbi:hypothetical protein Godav_013208, partial [Gossypium davidsonii]|nr:hypothetical protein [Gossypium davidsonii]